MPHIPTLQYLTATHNEQHGVCTQIIQVKKE